MPGAGINARNIAALRALLTEHAARAVRLYCARNGAIIPIDINLGERGA